MNQKEINKLLEGLFDGGYIFEKKIGRATPSAGAIYLPRKLIGKHFRVILVPMKDEEELEKNGAKTPSDVSLGHEPLAPINTKEGQEQRDRFREKLSEQPDRIKINTGITEKRE